MGWFCTTAACKAGWSSRRRSVRSQMTVGRGKESGVGGEGEAKVVGEEAVGSGRSCGWAGRGPSASVGRSVT